MHKRVVSQVCLVLPLYRRFLIRTGSGQNVWNNTDWTQEEGLWFPKQNVSVASATLGSLHKVCPDKFNNSNPQFHPQTRLWLNIEPVDFSFTPVCSDAARPDHCLPESLRPHSSLPSARSCSSFANSAMFHLWVRAGVSGTAARLQGCDENIWWRSCTKKTFGEEKCPVCSQVFFSTLNEHLF